MTAGTSMDIGEERRDEVRRGSSSSRLSPASACVVAVKDGEVRALEPAALVDLSNRELCRLQCFVVIRVAKDRSDAGCGPRTRL